MAGKLSGSPKGERPSGSAYLAACLAFKNEAPYLREWIEFHRLVGFERFFLYNHASVDGQHEALAPYVEDGLVTVEDWPDVPAVQTDMYNRCLEQHGHEARWIAFLDMDEFLFSPTGPLSELLTAYEDAPGVVANWAMFGTSGRRTQPSGLVIESYLWRNDEVDEPRNRLFKCIVDPARVTRCLDPHSFAFTEGSLVDERKQPVEGQFTERPFYSKLRINHYYTRSEEEAARKYAKGRGSDAVKMRGGDAPLEHLHERLNQKRDDAILGYVPAVRQALAEVNERAPFDPPRAAPTADGAVQFFERGRSALDCIEAAIEAADRLLPREASRSIDRILDLPCGRGRVMRVLSTAFPDAELTAGDIDKDAVDFCAEAYGAVPLYSDEDPARIETDAVFDLIWCGSLFSHLDADRWPGFLKFFETRLRPWGLLVFTTSGRFHAQNIVTRNREPDLAEAMRTAYTESGFAYQDDGPRPGWGTAIASPAWVCRQLEDRPGFRLLGYAERGWRLRQDVVACTRIGPRAQVRDLVATKPEITEDELVEVTGYDEPTVHRWLYPRRMRRTARHVNRRELLGGSRRRYDYDRRLLPNPHIATLEPAEPTSEEQIRDITDWSLGYPAWNLLYYTLYASILPERDDVVVIETGTNRGVTTIVIAQALADLGVDASVYTVEIDPDLVSVAQENVEVAGLTDRVRFHTGDAIEFLSDMAEQFDHFDFVLIDDLHTYPHVWDEIEIVCPKVAARGGKVYFDNTGYGDIDAAIIDLRKRYGGNLVHFDNCSHKPPGNAIWQPETAPADGSAE